MAFTKHNFQSGDRLLASQLNEIEAQIVLNMAKQDKLVAGSGIAIASDGKTISATGGEGGAALPGIHVSSRGLVGDGATDNSDAWEALYAENPNAAFEFDDGVYCFSRPIITNQTHIRLNNATIRATAEMDYLIQAKGYQEGEHPLDGQFIIGPNGTVDCNRLAKTGIGIGSGKMFEVARLTILNFTQVGLEHSMADRYVRPGLSEGELGSYSYEMNAHDLLIANIEYVAGTIGIKNAQDSFISRVVLLNPACALFCGGGGNLWSQIHAWTFNFDYQNASGNNPDRTWSIFGDMYGGKNNLFVDCYIDSYGTGFRVGDGGIVNAINTSWYISGKGWDETRQSVMFDALDGKPHIMAIGGYCAGGHNAIFSKGDMSESLFLGFDGAMDGITNRLNAGVQCPEPVSDTSIANKAYVDAMLSAAMAYTDECVARATGQETVLCTGVTLSETSVTLNDVGEFVTLSATLAPENTTQGLVWSSSSPSVATVENGKVTYIAYGTAVITATCGSYSATCRVTCAKNAYAVNRTNFTVTHGTPEVMYNAVFDLLGGQTIEFESAVGEVDDDATLTALFYMGTTPDTWGTDGSIVVYYNKTTQEITMQAAFNTADGSLWRPKVVKSAGSDTIHLKMTATEFTINDLDFTQVYAESAGADVNWFSDFKNLRDSDAVVTIQFGAQGHVAGQEVAYFRITNAS